MTRRADWWKWSLLTILLSACTVGPDYSRPVVELPAAYQSTDLWQPTAGAETPVSEHWWEAYGDPELNRLESTALEQNPGLQAIMARLEQAQAITAVTQADRYPRLDLNPTAKRSRSSAGTGNSFSLPVDLSYEVDLWGRVRRTSEAANADYTAVVADTWGARLALQAEVARTYFQLRAADAELAILQRTVVLREESRRVINSRFQAGQIGRIDLSRTDGELASAQADALLVEKSRREAEHALAALVGQPASSFSLAAGELPEQPPRFASGVPSTLLERRPDIAAAERRMCAANARIGVAKAAFFPSLQLFGQAGYQSSSVDALLDWDNRVWALGTSLTLPLFDGGRNRARLSLNQAVWEETLARYRETVLTAIRETEDGLAGMNLLAEQLCYLELAVVAARKTEELSRKRYDAGAVSHLEVADAERTALTAERLAVRAREQRLQTSVLLAKALGGGWQVPGSGP